MKAAVLFTLAIFLMAVSTAADADAQKTTAVAHLLTLIQYAVIVFALAGQPICESLGIIYFTPDFWTGFAEKRFSLIIGAFFFGNTIINSVVSTGAFEVLYGSEVIFSKLATGRMPRMDELLMTMQEVITASVGRTQ